MKRGGYLQRHTPLTARVGLRARSRKMAARYVERRRFVAHQLALHPRCQVGLDGVCTGTSSTLHERLSRARGGPIVPSQGLDPRDTVAACGPCHDWLHTHQAWAKANGWLRWSWER